MAKLNHINIALSDILKFHKTFDSENYIQGIYYPRCREYPLAVNNLMLTGNEFILDIGSRYSLLPYFIANLGCKIVSIDINSEIVSNANRNMSAQFKTNITYKCMDAADMDFPDEHFDRIYSIGVFEHIPDDFDIKAAAETGRVLKKGGIAVITIESTPDPSKNFWFRCYDDKDLINRIAVPSGLEIVDLGFFADSQYLPMRHITEKGWFKTYLQPLKHILSVLFYKQHKQYEKIKESIGSIGYIVLRKI